MSSSRKRSSFLSVNVGTALTQQKLNNFGKQQNTVSSSWCLCKKPTVGTILLILFSQIFLWYLVHITDLDICKICLEKQGDLFHDLCLIRSKLLDAAFDSAIQLQLWEVAEQYGVPLLKAYTLWYGEAHPLTGILLLKLFKILLLTSNCNDSIALKYYEQASAIIELTHGKSSSFYNQEVKPLLQQLRWSVCNVETK